MVGLAWGALAVAALPGTALAHAILKSSTPVANATVAGPDLDVLMHFNSRIDQQRSRLAVVLPDGSRKPLAIIPNQTDPTVLAGRLQGLVAGAYTLNWRVLSVDGHMTRGNVPFTVGGR